MGRGNETGTGDSPKRRATPSGKMTIQLTTGEKLEINKITAGGYIMAPIGAKILGFEPSRDIVGKYVICVEYSDGGEGMLAQTEIASISDEQGNPVEYGSANYPGHPDYDPRTAKNPIEEIFSKIDKKYKKRTD